jgi:D-arabinose 1-dehydrogenase-like Zn-dependent alcohol dehydrogenase
VLLGKVDAQPAADDADAREEHNNTQESPLDFCGERGITCEIEMIPMEKINDAYERMLKSDVKYRFVIDVGTLR